tara:strand:+ start:245 stop:691 length:447 start_codon:yes stop_codon:yes gene_type:complete
MIEWQTPEHSKRERGTDWYFAVGIIVVALGVTFIVFDNILLAGVVILAFIILLTSRNKETKIITVQIQEKGVVIGDMFYPYNNLEAFFVDEEHRQLFFRSEKILSPHISVPIPEDINIDFVQETLEELLPEERMQENIFERAFEYLGF